MMTCFEVDHWLAEYFAGDVSWPLAEELEQHLAICRDCGDRAAAFQHRLATIRLYLRRSSEPTAGEIPQSLLIAILAMAQSPGNRSIGRPFCQGV
jgi:anti-sigma factor ChrR (cupin superfamily)